MVYINDSAGFEQLPKRFVTEKAPRTGICAARNGTLIIVEVSVRHYKRVQTRWEGVREKCLA